VIVADVLNQLQNYETHFGLRQRRRRPADQKTFDMSVAALICDLLHRELTLPGGKLAVSLSNQVLGRAGRYGCPVLSKTLPELLKRMATPEMDWLQIEKGKQGYFGEGRLTTIHATPRLLRRMAEHAITLEDFKRAKGEEVIILKRSKDEAEGVGDYVDYRDTPQTRAYRSEVNRIHDWLEQADIDFDDSAAADKVVDPSDRLVRRYFNNGSFEQGGRLFGGFWQNLKKQERLDGILIDGEAVATLDFGQMALRILYGMVRAPAPEGDAYRIPGLEGHRKGVKKLFNAALFATEPFSRAPRGTRELLPERTSVDLMMERIKERHTPIAHLLFTGVGFQVMYQESEILVDALLTLTDGGVVALPIHDALAVPASKVSLVKDTMLSVFADHMRRVMPGDDWRKI
jgi:hypothetical protein